jgi:hypothetical protein
MNRDIEGQALGGIASTSPHKFEAGFCNKCIFSTAAYM